MAQTADYGSVPVLMTKTGSAFQSDLGQSDLGNKSMSKIISRIDGTVHS